MEAFADRAHSRVCDASCVDEEIGLELGCGVLGTSIVTFIGASHDFGATVAYRAHFRVVMLAE